MSFYPVMLNLKNKRVLVVGGGSVALRKIKSLIKTDAAITLISENIRPEIENYLSKIEYVKKKLEKKDLDYVLGFYMVILATNDIEIQDFFEKALVENEKLFLRADLSDKSSFMNVSSIDAGEISISVSTTGASPKLSNMIRKEIEEKVDIKEYSKRAKLLKEYRMGLKKEASPEIRKIKKLSKMTSSQLAQTIYGKSYSKPIIIGSRGSDLAVEQSLSVKKAMLDLYPSLDIDVKLIKTLGDIKQDTALDALNRKGIFTQEIEESLKKQDIDLAVHSMKDMPSEIDDAFSFSMTLKREDPSDCLVMKKGTTIEDLKNKDQLRIGTGSKRRSVFIKRFFENVEIVPIRGNVQTRIKKIDELDLDGVVLAKAGINRLNLLDENIYVFPKDVFYPAPCQGILAIQTLKSSGINKLIKNLNDEKSYFELKVERAFMKELRGGCHAPMGINLSYDGDIVEINALFGSQNLKVIKDKTIKVNKERAIDEAIKLARELKKEVEHE